MKLSASLVKTEKYRFLPANQYRNFGFEKSSGIPVLKALLGCA
jgi:hypothetical protein